MADETYQDGVYREQGADRLVVASGGSLDVESGGEIDIESGGALKLAGTALTSTAAELNILDGVTATAAELNILDGVTATAAELNILDGVTATAAELNLVDGASVDNDTASKAAVLDASKRLVTAANNGTPGTGVTAVEIGNGLHHVSILTLSGVAATIGDNAALAGGALIYTLPAGAIVIHSATMSVGLSLTTGTPTTDTPELGLGNVQGSGANATLGDVDAGCENILGPAVADDIAGTAELLTAATGLKLEAADAHTIYFNYADTWADVDDTVATLDGTVVLEWTLLPVA